MPIDFQCPKCQSAMRLPDSAAGKQGKCPKCGVPVTVPAPGAAGPAPGDEEFWSELDQDDSPQPEAEEDHGGHERKTDAQALKMYLGDPAEEAEKELRRSGLPFDREKVRFEFFWDSAVQIMNHPHEAFSIMKLDGGIKRPIIFAVFGALIGYPLLAFYLAAIVGLQGSGSINPNAEGAQAEINSLIFSCVGVLLAVIFQGLAQATIGLFIQAGVAHMGLSIMKGAARPFEVTLRVMGYIHGTIALCLIVPAIGPVAMLLLWLMGVSKGMPAAHGVSNGKAAIGLLLSLLSFVVVVIGPIALTLYMAGVFEAGAPAGAAAPAAEG